MRMSRLLIALALAVSACSTGAADKAGSAPQDSAAVHPESGLALIEVTVGGKDGRHRFRAELAASRFEQARGLMFRTALGPDEAMLFPLDPPRQASFWMRNTLIPLDIIFVGPDRRILNIAANTVPYDETPLRSEGEAAAVLEIAGGRAAQLGIEPGDKVDW
jgi:uncharacterized protein